MAKKIPINVPVYIQDVQDFGAEAEKGNGKFTTAKLKIFYEGETVDHRLFTKAFSDRIMQTLPYTPVVGYYSEEDEDFKGHNVIQYVYGLVPENPTISEERDPATGNVFKVTDVILYTERPDNIGEVARKIVGKQHSLELDRASLQYRVNRNFDGTFRNLEFLDGKFVGLSVLGDEESPAFAGSAFFAENDALATIAEKFSQNLDSFIQFLNEHDGGSIEIMEENTYFSTVSEFFKMTMQETERAIYDAFCAEGKCGFLVQNSDTEAVFMEVNEVGEVMHNRYSYTIAEGNKVVLGDPVRVYARYLTTEELDKSEAPEGFEAQPEPKEDDDEDKEESVCAAQEEEEKPEQPAIEPKEDDEEEKPTFVTTDEDEDKTDEEQPSSPVEDTDEPKKETEDEDKDDEEEDKTSFAATTSQGEDINAEQTTEGATAESEEQVGEVAASFSSTALTSEERAELESFRRKEKSNLIATYTSDLPEEVLADFTKDMDSYSLQDLEAKLAIAFRKFSKLPGEQPSSYTGSQPYSFRACGATVEYDENDPVQVINKYK